MSDWNELQAELDQQNPALMGRKGGLSRSQAKAQAARVNGAQGGRPRGAKKLKPASLRQRRWRARKAAGMVGTGW